MKQQYSIRYEQVPDKDDPRGYRWEETERLEVVYDEETKSYSKKKGATWK